MVTNWREYYGQSIQWQLHVKGFEDVVRKVYTFQIERDSTWEMYWASVDKTYLSIRDAL